MVDYCCLYCLWLEASGTDYNWYAAYCIIYKMFSPFMGVSYFRNSMLILLYFLLLTILPLINQ